MKTLISIIALVASVGTASAMIPGGLSDADAFEVRSIVPTADLSGLTAAQSNAIADALRSDEEHIGGQIRSILMWN